VQGILVVAGFSQCGVEFHLKTLSQLQQWPRVDRHLLEVPQIGGRAQLAVALEHNSFRLIIISALMQKQISHSGCRGQSEPVGRCP
jgi:hypothetical protein